MKNAYESFLAHRQSAIRAAGKLIAERLEAGQSLATIADENGNISGLNGVRAKDAILLSGISHSRKIAALKAWNALKADA